MDMKRILLASIYAALAPAVTVIGAEEGGLVPSTDEIIRAFSDDQERGEMIKYLVKLLRGDDIIDPQRKIDTRNQVIDRLKGTLQYEVVKNDLEKIRYHARLTLDVLAHVAANDLKNLIQENKVLKDEKGFEDLVQQAATERIQQLTDEFSARSAELQKKLERLEQALAGATRKAKVVQNVPQPVNHVDNGATTNDGVRKKGKRHKTEDFKNFVIHRKK